MPDFQSIKYGRKQRRLASSALDVLQPLLESLDMPMKELKGNWQAKLHKILYSEAMEHAEAAVGFVAGSLLVPGSGVMAALSVELGSQFHRDKKIFETGDKPTKRGQWIIIHNGEERLKEALEGTLTHQLGVYKSISIGFYLDAGSRAGYAKVYDYEAPAGVKERKLDDIILMPPGDTRNRLEAEPRFTVFRAAIIQREYPGSLPKTLGSVNVDPGAEVRYKGKSYYVENSSGRDIEISNSEETLDVPYDQLSAGRQASTAGYSYNTTSTEGFVADSSPHLYANQWVWLVPRDSSERDAQGEFIVKRELGVLRLINTDIYDGYYAIDGIRFQVSKVQIRPASRSEAGVFDLSKEFVMFKAAAATGEDVRRLRLGRNNIRTCLGQTVQLDTPGATRAGEEGEGEFETGEISEEQFYAAEKQLTVEGKAGRPDEGSGGWHPYGSAISRDSTLGTSRQQEMHAKQRFEAQTGQRSAHGSAMDIDAAAKPKNEGNMTYVLGAAAVLLVYMVYG